MKKSGAEIRSSPRIREMMAAKKAEMKKSPKVENVALDPYEAAEKAKDMIRGQTAFICPKSETEGHFNPWDGNHIERPERVSMALDRCEEFGLVQRCLKLPAKKAEMKDILKVHSKDHLDKMNELSSDSLNAEQRQKACLKDYHSVYFNGKTAEAASFAAGAVIDVTDAVIKGQAQNGFALVRPPGHHAMKSEFCGFCVLNNVAVAAQRALDEHSLNRILIIDFDVHHGQATQQTFF